MRTIAALDLMLVLATPDLAAWGERGHQTVNRAAVRAIPDDGPVFLRGA